MIRRRAPLPRSAFRRDSSPLPARERTTAPGGACDCLSCSEGPPWAATFGTEDTSRVPSAPVEGVNTRIAPLFVSAMYTSPGRFGPVYR